MKKELATAYAASFARVASWAVVAGLVYRHDGKIAFGAFSYQRAAITLMMVSGLGLAPALIILLPKIRAAAKKDADGLTEDRLFGTAGQLAFAASCFLVIVGLYLSRFFPKTQFWVLFSSSFSAFLIATGLRLISDVCGSWLQINGRLSRDYLLQAGSDLGWATAVLINAKLWPEMAAGTTLPFAATAYVGANAALGLARYGTAIIDLTRQGRLSMCVPLVRDNRRRLRSTLDASTLLLGTGGILLLAQIADLLYAPANQAIIKHYLSADALATYAPLLHIDAALLLGIGGLSNLLLPKSAIAHGAGDRATVRRYYELGTIVSVVFLAIGATLAWLFATPLFKAWFGNPLTATQAILPLVMIHTVIGGSASIGRSILFGIGQIKAYTIAAILGGVANVVLAILLVTQTKLGLKGIVLATIVTVTIRCAIWMPWYVLRALREGEKGNGEDEISVDPLSLSPIASPLPPTSVS